MLRRLVMSCASVALALALSLGAAWAQSYPTKPVTVIVPWPAGGRTDLTARLTTQFLAEKLGKPVVVVNQPGASGVLGAKKVTTSAADGYTLGFFSSGVVATQYTVPAPSDLKDYAPVGLINMDEAALAVPEPSPFKDLGSLVRHARANPGALKLGTAPGTSAHLMAAQFAKAARVEFLPVPFGGGGARSVALAGQHIDVDVDVPAIYKALMEAGKIRVLGLGADKRSPLFPAVATFREQGVDCVIGTWNGLFAPKGTPADVMATLDRALASVANDPRFIDMMHKSFLGVRHMGRDEFRRFLAEEDASIRQITQELGLQEQRK
jgi:tripartite-type tricarboxylate transporter receptor subunit TctC